MVEDIESQLAKYAQAVSWLRHRYVMDDEAHLITITQGPSQPDLSQALLQVGASRPAAVCNRGFHATCLAPHAQTALAVVGQRDALSYWHTCRRLLASCAELILLSMVCLCHAQGKHTRLTVRLQAAVVHVLADL